MEVDGRHLSALIAAGIAAMLAAVLAFAAPSCGRGSQPDGLVSIQATDSMGSLETAAPDPLAELDALACPAGVDDALWGELKEALEEALACRAATCMPPSGVAEGDSARYKSAPYKFASTPPTGEANRVNDLTITDNGDGTYTLTWHYRNLGDYGQNGVVALEDIYPLAQHFGETYDAEAEPDCIQAVIDGSGNGKVGIEEVTPIARNFTASVHHYAIEGAETSEGPWSAVGEVQQSAGTGEGRLEYSSAIQSPAALWHRVVPYDSEGTAGELSNAVLRPSNEPIIYGVTPTEGYQYEEYTFTAVVTGAEPLTYAWDFGGGAEPNVSSATAPTVTLADAGEYSATLTVTNPYGSADFPFTLAVSERDTWAHTWGTESNDYVGSLAVSEEGEVWISGGGYAGDFLVKFSSSGEFQWAKRWESDVNCSWGQLWRYSDGRILTSDSCRIPPNGYHDVLVVEFSPDGEVLRTLAWGTDDHHEWINASTVDAAGNIYLAGTRVRPFGEKSLLLMKLDAEWNVLWAKAWQSTGDEAGVGILLDTNAFYVTGSIEDNTSLMKVSLDGEVLWVKTWDSGGQDSLRRMALGPDGGIYALGSCIDDTGLMLKYSAEGTLLAVRGWDMDQSNRLEDLCFDPYGNVTAVGGVGLDLIAQMLDSTLGFIDCVARDQSYASACAFGRDGDLYVAGWTESLEGEWRPVEDKTFVPDGTEGTGEGSAVDLSGTSWIPEGMMTDVEGVVDAPAGGTDFLILKNYPK